MPTVEDKGDGFTYDNLSNGVTFPDGSDSLDLPRKVRLYHNAQKPFLNRSTPASRVAEAVISSGVIGYLLRRRKFRK